MSALTERKFGVVEWFRPARPDHAEAVIEEARAAGIRQIRTQLSWAEWHTEGGPEWYDWLMPRLGDAFDVTACLAYTPPSVSRTGKSSGPPQRLRDYADFLDTVLDRHGARIGTVELWNEPNNLLDWDWRIDPKHELFAEMVRDAANWARERGFRTVLGGPCPFDPVFLDQMGRLGVLDLVSAVGLHGFPGTWNSEAGGWEGWPALVAETRGVLDRWNGGLEVWITEAGYSTWRHDEIAQLRRFLEFLDAPADRHFWYGWRDLDPDVAVQEGAWSDARHYHMGMADAQGRPKLLGRLLTSGGIEAVEQVVALAAPSLRREASRPVVVTGGSGFIGANVAESFLADGDEVAVVDNLSRAGVEENLVWLRDAFGDRVDRRILDIRDARALTGAVADARAVFHFAAQTAVTTSLAEPGEDFEVNARGTLNLLEAVRGTGGTAPVIFASTNKVYGDLGDVEFESFPDRMLPRDPAIRARGVDEDRPLKFCTPYGCSKGVADQYVLDWAASYGLRTAVARMSCVYGPRQFGTEDQGWVAHFLLRALKGEEITLFGDGRQVRDILHVSDAVAAYRGLFDNIDTVSGKAFNLGGGARNAVSLKVLLDEIGRILGRPAQIRHEALRQGDQPYFVADTTRLEMATGWHADVGWRDGVSELARWLEQNRLSGQRSDTKPVLA